MLVHLPNYSQGREEIYLAWFIRTMAYAPMQFRWTISKHMCVPISSPAQCAQVFSYYRAFYEPGQQNQAAAAPETDDSRTELVARHNFATQHTS
jgi:hypothetical protein